MRISNDIQSTGLEESENYNGSDVTRKYDKVKGEECYVLRSENCVKNTSVDTEVKAKNASLGCMARLKGKNATY